MSNIEKIKAEIERRKKENMYVDLPMSIGRYYEDRDILAFIDSLPDEKTTCKTCGFYENNCPFIRGKLIPYPNKVCKDYTYSAMKEQEKPSEDLEEAADDMALKAFPEKKSYSTVYERVVDYNAVDRKNYRDGIIAGAEWQKKQDMDEWLKDRDGCFWDGVNEGKKAMEEQMTEEAVEGEIGYWNQTGLSILLDQSLEKLGYDEDTKVKIIIVKQ